MRAALFLVLTVLRSESAFAQSATAYQSLMNAAAQPSTYEGARAGFGEKTPEASVAVTGVEPPAAGLALDAAAAPLQEQPAPVAKHGEHNLVKKGRALGGFFGTVAGIAGGAWFGYHAGAAAFHSQLGGWVGALLGGAAGVVSGLTLGAGLGMILGLYVAFARGEGSPD